MTVFQIIAILLTFAAAGSYVNKRVLQLPTSIGMMLLTLLMSWTVMGAARIGLLDLSAASAFVRDIDFPNLFLHGMLSFLLFSGALHIDLAELKKFRSVVVFLATIGVVIAVFVTGGIVWKTSQILNFDMPLIDALLFGALIAPTDPVAVLGVLKGTSLGKGVRMKISSESLLNDGVGVVIFLAILSVATHPQNAASLPWKDIFGLFFWQACGSIILGSAMGAVGCILLRSIDDYKTEILLTLSLASGGYCFAEGINVSAPITMVIVGLIIGNQTHSFAQIGKPRKSLEMFWELLDDILNSVLFVLIGLEIMIVPMTSTLLAMGIIAIAATIIGRFISVAIPISVMRYKVHFEKGTIRLMTWGGLRGGISIAMALSLPASPYKNMLLGMTYLTVVSSVLIQGTSFSKVANKIIKE